MSLLSELGATSPVVAAPMAGGPTTPALVIAAAHAGSLGFVAGGYLDAESLADQIGAAAAGTDTYGVNLFSPHPVAVDPSAYTSDRDLLAREAERRGVGPATLPPPPGQEGRGWRGENGLRG